MSVITKGKTFANGEQLTAGKLNQMLDAATFSSSAVDNTKTTLSGGAITIAPNGVGFSELSDALVNDTDAMTDASSTTLATSESIKAYVDAEILASRPKFVAGTAGTDQSTTGGSAGTTNALSRELSNPTGDTTFTYNLADFRSDDADFNADGVTLGYKKIVGIYVSGFVSTKKNITFISGTVPGDTLRTFVKIRTAYTSASGTPQNEAQSFAYFPVNPNQSQFQLKHFRNTDDASTVGSLVTNHTIVGFNIIPNLPVS